ncbi:MAG: hypothetical protein EPN91_09400 [Salinibacterium sp.]|nr:MAG: hypothetical protein EPN91_09400 [Salinibacterium sp.]
MRKPTKLTGRQAWMLQVGGHGWRAIMHGRDDERLTARLEALKLARRASPHAGCWILKLTPLGLALTCLITRRTGGKLTRHRVSLLARHRARLFERFDVEQIVTAVQAEHRKLVLLKTEQAVRDVERTIRTMKVRPRG